MIYGPRIKGYWPLLIILILALTIVHANWIFSFAPLQSADWPYFFRSQLVEWFPAHYHWIAYDGLGRGISQGNFTLLFSIYGLLAYFGANFEIVSRLLFFWPVLICAPLGSYLAVREVTGNRVAAVVGAFVYSLNTYFIVIQAGHMHISVAYALAPFVYYFAAKVGRRSFFWFFVFLAIISVYDVRMALVIGSFGAVIAVYHKVRNRHDLLKLTKAMVVGGICLALFSFYWILPMHYTLNGPFTRNVFDQQALNWISSLDSFSIHHPFWSSGGVTDFIFEPAPFYMFALPILAFAPFALPRKSWDGMNRALLFYGLVALASIILLMQENSLLARLYTIIYDNIPLMSMFRESSKMFFITSFCYSVLIGFLLIELYKRRETKYGTFVMCLTIFVLLAPISPYLTGKFVKAYKQEPIKPEILAVNQLVNKTENLPSRTLWVSRMPEFAKMGNTTPAIDGADFGSKYWNKYANPFAGRGITFMQESNAPALLNFAGLQHVVVPPDDADSNFHHYDHKSADYYIDAVKAWGLKELKPIGKYRIWENKAPKPYLYFSTNNINVDSVSMYSGIDDSVTSAYLFSDQNSDKARSDTLQKATNNSEYSIFQPKYSEVEAGQITSTFKKQTNEKLKLFTIDQQAKKREFIEHDYQDGHAVDVADKNITGKNLYKDGSFENISNVKVGDCNNDDNTSAKSNGITGLQVPDATDGKFALSVSARKHIACFFKEIPQYDDSANYMVSFDYKYVSGKAPYLAFYPFKEEPIKRQVSLNTDKPGEWRSFQTVIKPGQFVDNIDLNLYVPAADNAKSETLFDNIQVFQVSFVPEAYLRTVGNVQRAKTIQEIENSPVKHVLKVDNLDKARLLVFSESFDPNWRVTIRPHDKSNQYIMPVSSHLQTNGFANGWWIDPEAFPKENISDKNSYIITMDYLPQQWAYRGAFVTAIVIAGVAVYLCTDLIHERKNKKLIRRL